MATDCKGCSRFNGKRNQAIPHRTRKSDQSHTESSLRRRKVSCKRGEESRYQDLERDQSPPTTHENRSPENMVRNQSHRLLGQRTPPQVFPLSSPPADILVFSLSSILSSPPSSTSSPASKPSSAASSSTFPNYYGKD